MSAALVQWPGIGAAGSGGPSTLTLAPSDDATIRAGSKSDTNYGGEPDLLVDRSSRKDFLLRFDVAGIGSPVLSATLRLHAIDPSSFGGEFTEVTDSSWNEATVTWDSAPEGDGLALGALGRVETDTWYEHDVTPLIVGDGPVSIRVDSTSSNGAD